VKARFVANNPSTTPPQVVLNASGIHHKPKPYFRKTFKKKHGEFKCNSSVLTSWFVPNPIDIRHIPWVEGERVRCEEMVLHNFVTNVSGIRHKTLGKKPSQN